MSEQNFKRVALTRGQVLAFSYVDKEMAGAFAQGNARLAVILEEAGVDPQLVGKVLWNCAPNLVGEVLVPVDEAPKAEAPAEFVAPPVLPPTESPVPE